METLNLIPPKTSLFIFEGPDGVGKTTASNRFGYELGWGVRHMTKPPIDFNYTSDYFDPIFNRAEFVLDRFHLGGIVYGKQTNLHPNRVSDETLKYVQLRLKYEFNARVVIMYYESDEKYRDRLIELKEERKCEEMFTLEDCVRVNAKYRDNINDWTKNHVIDFSHPVDELGYPDEKTITKWATSTL